MKRIIIIYAFLLLCIYSIQAQVGINTTQPLGWFHVDGIGNTTTVNGVTTNDNDDFIVTNDGNIGIGTTNPTSKLTISTTGNNTGLQMKKGAFSGYILAGDKNGNARWSSSAKHLFTYLVGSGQGTNVNTSSANKYALMTAFSLSYDQAKATYGSDYGWNTTTSQYKVPATGIYRIVINGYFNTVASGRNIRIYVYLNGVQNRELGMISVTDPGGDISSYTSTIANLKKNDVIDFRIGAEDYVGTKAATYYASAGHTYAYIEAL